MKNDSFVGAGILNIVTESLYDKPIVVFREYVQNSIDAFRSITKKRDSLECHIWIEEGSIFFLDNGTGIQPHRFEETMKLLASSEKDRKKNLGYKGIGRLSGLPYCSMLKFINIISYKDQRFQQYYFDGEKYKDLKNDLEYQKNHSYIQFINDIQSLKVEELDGQKNMYINSILQKHGNIFKEHDSGFLVVLENINLVLKEAISINIREDLEWLLPVPFNKELLELDDERSMLFKNISLHFKSPAEGYNIYYCGKKLYRPINKDCLREYVCKKEFSSATCFFTFDKEGISINKKKLTGIRLYNDNMLLCDENEIVPSIVNFGFVHTSEREILQAVKGLGVMIYITGNDGIGTNARRTFIEVTNDNAITFLRELSTFVEQINITRYALSNYYSAKKKEDEKGDEIEKLQKKAIDSLNILVEKKIQIGLSEESTNSNNIDNDIEKQKAVRRKLSLYMNNAIKEYLAQIDEYTTQDAEIMFSTWFKANK